MTYRTGAGGAAAKADDVSQKASELTYAVAVLAGIRWRNTYSQSIVSEAADVTHKADGEVARLAEAADKIGHVVDLIRAIAEQTNLLALMPRSRPHGRGRPAGALRLSPPT